LEVGIFEQFLSQPFNTYGDFSTTTLGKQIWAETEPYGITLQAAPDAIWTPSPLGENDLPIITLAHQVYNKKGATIINRCRLYLNVISMYDFFIYDGSHIHPSFFQGEPPPSHRPLIHLPAYPRPPKAYWKLWTHFLSVHVTAYRQSIQFQWNTAIPPNYTVTLYRHWTLFKLYRFVDGEKEEFAFHPV
jgi:hypothetical protein